MKNTPPILSEDHPTPIWNGLTQHPWFRFRVFSELSREDRANLNLTGRTGRDRVADHSQQSLPTATPQAQLAILYRMATEPKQGDSTALKIYVKQVMPVKLRLLALYALQKHVDLDLAQKTFWDKGIKLLRSSHVESLFLRFIQDNTKPLVFSECNHRYLSSLELHYFYTRFGGLDWLSDCAGVNGYSHLFTVMPSSDLPLAVDFVCRQPALSMPLQRDLPALIKRLNAPLLEKVLRHVSPLIDPEGWSWLATAIADNPAIKTIALTWAPHLLAADSELQNLFPNNWVKQLSVAMICEQSQHAPLTAHFIDGFINLITDLALEALSPIDNKNLRLTVEAVCRLYRFLSADRRKSVNAAIACIALNPISYTMDNDPMQRVLLPRSCLMHIFSYWPEFCKQQPLSDIPKTLQSIPLLNTVFIQALCYGDPPEASQFLSLWLTLINVQDDKIFTALFENFFPTIVPNELSSALFTSIALRCSRTQAETLVEMNCKHRPSLEALASRPDAKDLNTNALSRKTYLTWSLRSLLQQDLAERIRQFPALLKYLKVFPMKHYQLTLITSWVQPEHVTLLKPMMHCIFQGTVQLDRAKMREAWINYLLAWLNPQVLVQLEPEDIRQLNHELLNTLRSSHPAPLPLMQHLLPYYDEFTRDQKALFLEHIPNIWNRRYERDCVDTTSHQPLLTWLHTQPTINIIIFLDTICLSGNFMAYSLPSFFHSLCQRINSEDKKILLTLFQRSYEQWDDKGLKARCYFELLITLPNDYIVSHVTVLLSDLAMENDASKRQTLIQNLPILFKHACEQAELHPLMVSICTDLPASYGDENTYLTCLTQWVTLPLPDSVKTALMNNDAVSALFPPSFWPDPTPMEEAMPEVENSEGAASPTLNR
jgi:hypothetical protein